MFFGLLYLILALKDKISGDMDVGLLSCSAVEVVFELVIIGGLLAK